MLNGLDLFSGLGGITLGLSEYVRPIAYCENDRYAQGVILSNISRGSLPNAPIWDDVRTLKGDHVGSVDIIYGGFPCQDISVAGSGVGLGGERSGLFFHIARLIEETNPKFVFLENVPAIRTRGLNGVIQTLTELGYDCRWTIVSAAEVGAPHLRKRWFLLAHANSERRWAKQISVKERENQAQPRDDGEKKYVADPDRERLERESISKARSLFATERSWWTIEPNVGRVAHGIPARVDRIKGLGNSVVPLQARTAFERLMGFSQ